MYLSTFLVFKNIYYKHELSTSLKDVYTLYSVYTIQQTSSISMCILNTFAKSLLDVCWIV